MIRVSICCIKKYLSDELWFSAEFFCFYAGFLLKLSAKQNLYKFRLCFKIYCIWGKVIGAGNSHLNLSDDSLKIALHWYDEGPVNLILLISRCCHFDAGCPCLSSSGHSSVELAVTGSGLPVSLVPSPSENLNFLSTVRGQRVDMLCVLQNFCPLLPINFRFRKTAHFTTVPSAGTINPGQCQVRILISWTTVLYNPSGEVNEE